MTPTTAPVGSGGAGRCFVWLIESTWRRRGMVSLFWQPPGSSRFWSEHGVLSILVNALVTMPAAGGGPGVADRLEAMGVTVRVQEDEFHCELQMVGDQHALLRGVPLVQDALAAGQVSPTALVGAARRFVQERHARRMLRSHRAEVARWQTFVARPGRLWRDFGPAVDDVVGGAQSLAAEVRWLGVSGVVVIGSESLATAWQDPRTPRAVAAGAAERADLELTATRRDHTPAVAPGGAATAATLVSYGAVCEISSPHEAYAQELAVEILAGWTGSRLHVLLRDELALTYAVVPAVRVHRLGERTLIHWKIDTTTAAGDAERVRAQIARQLDLLCDDPPSDAEVGRAALRMIRRSRLREDSVSAVMASDGYHARLGLPGWSAQRSRFLARAGASVLATGLERTRSQGVFVVVGAARPGSGGADVRA